jgi:hypothetical protein
MAYFPAIKSADPRRKYVFGGYTAVLLDRVRSAQTVQYNFVLLVFRDGDDSGLPCLALASEYSDDESRRMPFLGLFPGDGHANLGASAEWLDLEAFARESMRVAAEHLGVAPGTPVTTLEAKRRPWWK